jgi:hypothetical protein
MYRVPIEEIDNDKAIILMVRLKNQEIYSDTLCSKEKLQSALDYIVI